MCIRDSLGCGHREAPSVNAHAEGGAALDAHLDHRHHIFSVTFLLDPADHLALDGLAGPPDPGREGVLAESLLHLAKQGVEVLDHLHDCLLYTSLRRAVGAVP